MNDDDIRQLLGEGARAPRRPPDMVHIRRGSARRFAITAGAVGASLVVVLGLAAANLQPPRENVVLAQPTPATVLGEPEPAIPGPDAEPDEHPPTAAPVPHEPTPQPSPHPPPPPDPRPVDEPEQEQPVDQFHVTATVEVVDASAPVPFTVDVTHPGLVTTAADGSHEVGFTSTDGTVHLDDPRFHTELRDGDGRLHTAGPRCTPDGPCLSDFGLVRIDEGRRTALVIQLGTWALAPGRYVLDQPVAWSGAEDPIEVNWHDNAPERQEPDGRATVRIVYEVAA